MADESIGSTIVMSEANLHQLILIAGRAAYERAAEGVPWYEVQQELIDKLVATTEPLSEEQSKQLLGE